jgi:hypothetical protein
MKRYIVYNDDEVSSYSNWDAAKKDAKDLDDVNCHFYAVRIFNESELKEFAWEWFKTAIVVERTTLGIENSQTAEENIRKAFLILWKEQS